MKKLIFVVLVALLGLNAQGQDPRSAKWDAAATAYSTGDYAAATQQYESLIKEGARSWELYYNLGSSYFKSNQLGRAILNFERALTLDPGNEDIEHNLAVAESRTVDKIESVPQFFVVEWIVAVGSSMSSDLWAITGVFLLAISLILIIIWRLRKAHSALVGGYITGFLMIISFLFAHSAYSTVGQSDSAIVINTASVVRSSPDASGKELFVLHEGSKVTIVDHLGSWIEIRIASGNKGWVTSSDIEKI